LRPTAFKNRSACAEKHSKSNRSQNHQKVDLTVLAYRLRPNAYRLSPIASGLTSLKKPPIASFESLSIGFEVLREPHQLILKRLVIGIVCDVGSKQHSEGFWVDCKEPEVEESMQIGAEQQAVFEVVVFGATVRVDMGGFEQFHDGATGDRASGLEVR
jgi:hypothetical protein